MTLNHEPPCESETDLSHCNNHALLESQVLKEKVHVYFFLREAALATHRRLSSKEFKTGEQTEWKQKFPVRSKSFSVAMCGSHKLLITACFLWRAWTSSVMTDIWNTIERQCREKENMFSKTGQICKYARHIDK